MILNRLLTAAILLAATCAVMPVQAGTIPIPGGSFELPGTLYVNINIDSWQKPPKPAGYDESGGFMWTQLTGLFKNTPEGSDDHLDNCDGNQAIWLFAVPEVGLFQDYDSVDWHNLPPTHAFDATFTIGQAYDLTVGVNGGGGGMWDGVTLEISLYYRDGGGNKVTVASTTAVNSLANFPTHTHLTDYTVHVPVVKAGDPWAGKHIGVRFLSTVTPALEGGYWDLDNVRLTTVTLPDVQQTRVGNQVQLSWFAATGTQYQVEVSTTLGSWQPYDAPIAGTGATTTKFYPLSGQARTFLRVRATSPP